MPPSHSAPVTRPRRPRISTILVTNRRSRPILGPSWVHLIEPQKVAAQGPCPRSCALGWREARSRHFQAVGPQYVVVSVLTARQISCKLGHPEIVEMSQKRLEKCQGEACSTGRSKALQVVERHPEFRRGQAHSKKRFSRGLERGHQRVFWRSKVPFLWGRAPAVVWACCGKFNR